MNLGASPGGEVGCYATHQEACDTAAPPTCVGLGYLGGSATCIDCTMIDASHCQVCEPTVDACVSLAPGTYIDALASSGSALLVDRYLFHGNTEVGRSQEVDAVYGLTGTPNGWLAVIDPSGGSASLVTIALDGTVGPMLPSDIEMNVTGLAYAAGLVAVVYRTKLAAKIEILDPTGAVVVPSQDFGSESNVLYTSAPTTDGTSFFVGTPGALMRFGSDGTQTQASGFAPSGGTPFWLGSDGWYVSGVGGGPKLQVQPFDSTASALGSAFGVTLDGVVYRCTVVGGELVALVVAGGILELQTIDGSGSVGVPVPIAALGQQNSPSFPLMGSYGSDVAVTWSNFTGTSDSVHVVIAHP